MDIHIRKCQAGDAAFLAKSIIVAGRALGLMLEGAGKDFDPILIKIFINILGVYPVGTLLKLDTGELALVISSSRKKKKKGHWPASWM